MMPALAETLQKGLAMIAYGADARPIHRSDRLLRRHASPQAQFTENPQKRSKDALWTLELALPPKADD